MKRNHLSLAIGITTTMATFGVGATETIYEDDSGVKLGIGLSSEFIPRFVENLDFNDDVENGFFFDNPRPGTADAFGSGSLSPLSGLNSDDNSGQISAENRFWFDASKGNFEMRTMIEWDGTLDEQAIDDNDPNLERIRASYTAPALDGAKFSIGADFYMADTVGRKVYADDDPGFWVNGETSGVSYQLGFHKRNEGSGAAGDTAGRQSRNASGRDHDIFSGRLGFSGDLGAGSSWYLEPFAIVQNRNSEDLSRGGVAQSTNAVAGYFGSGARYQNGAFLIEGEFITHQGQINGTNTASMRDGFNENFDDMDISSFASYLRIMQKNAILGKISPYVSWDWASGDDDPRDDDLEGWVPIGTSNDLRADNIDFIRLSVANQMPNAIGNNAVEFGFETNTLGIGPNVGGILNTGLGANPGFHRVQAGVKGGLTGNWRVSARVVHMRFAATEAAVAGAQARGQDDVTDVDAGIGNSFDLQFPYDVTDGLTVSPYGSVFLPGDGAEELAGNDDTAFYAGAKIMANF